MGETNQRYGSESCKDKVQKEETGERHLSVCLEKEEKKVTDADMVHKVLAAFVGVGGHN
jgi:hypothetical protein